MKRFRYPLLFLAVLLIPNSFATIFSSEFISIPGYVIGYLSVYILTTAVNYFTKETIYSKRIRITYLIFNAFVTLLIFRTIGFVIGLLYMSYILSPTSAILLVGLPWIAVQMLLLYFFVRYESLDK